MKLKNFLSSAASLFAFQDLKPNFKAHPGSTPTRRKAPLRIDRFADELPYAQFEESDKLCVIAAPDGSFEGLGFVIEVTPQTGTSLNMAKSLEHMIGSILPDGTGVQVSLFGSPFIEPLVELVRSQTLRPTPEDTPARAEQKDLLSAMTQSFSRALRLKRPIRLCPSSAATFAAGFRLSSRLKILLRQKPGTMRSWFARSWCPP